jgi:hypothetical protein
VKSEYITPQERQAVIDAVKAFDAVLPPDADEREHLASVLPKLAAYFADHDALTNIAAIAHNSVVWFSSNRKRMFHKLGDLAEAVAEREGKSPDESPSARAAVAIRSEWGHHINE